MMVNRCGDCVLKGTPNAPARPLLLLQISEDFAFCDRWRGVGGEIWVDLTTGLNHTGTFRFEGANWIKR